MEAGIEAALPVEGAANIKNAEFFISRAGVDAEVAALIGRTLESVLARGGMHAKRVVRGARLLGAVAGHYRLLLEEIEAAEAG